MNYSVANAQPKEPVDHASPVVTSPWMLDQRAWVVGRSYPAGGQVFYTLGTNYQLWGDSSTWKYGYFRAALNAATSAVVDRAGFELQFYPISIFGVSAGYDWGFRFIQMKFADCDAYECMGQVNRAFVKSQLLAAYKNLILIGNFRYEHLSHASNSSIFFDEMTLLPCRSLGENVLQINPSLLYTVNEKVKVGGTSVLARGITSGTISHMYGPVGQYAFSPRMNLALGFGPNFSTAVHSALTAFAMFNYTIDPSLSVIDLNLRN